MIKLIESDSGSKKSAKKSSKKSVSPNARKDATDAILAMGNDNPDAPSATEYTEDELPRLDYLFDVISWLIHLYSGNLDLMNESGEHIDIPTLDADQAAKAKSKLDGKVKQLINKVEKIVESPEPVEDAAIDDIKNELRSYY